MAEYRIREVVYYTVLADDACGAMRRFLGEGPDKFYEYSDEREVVDGPPGWRDQDCEQDDEDDDEI